jgi:hypothetical protein
MENRQNETEPPPSDFPSLPAYAAAEQAGMILSDEAEFDSREDRACAAANFREARDLLSASLTVLAVE